MSVTLTLNGDASMVLFLYEENAFVDPVATALDATGDRTVDMSFTYFKNGVSVRAIGARDDSQIYNGNNQGTNDAGTYDIIYTVDSDSITRTIEVTDESIYTHSVQFDNSFMDFDVVAFGDLSTNVTQTFSFKDIFYQKGFDLNDISAVAYIDVSADDYKDLFKLNIPLYDASASTDLDQQQIRYFTNKDGWKDVSFSQAEVSFNPIFLNAVDQTIAKDFTRSMFNDVLSNSRLNRLFTNQGTIVAEIKALDVNFNNQINEIITLIGEAGFLTDADYGAYRDGSQAYVFDQTSTFADYTTRTDDLVDVSNARAALYQSSFSAFNPLRILSSSILGEDDYDEVGAGWADISDISGAGIGNFARRNLAIADLCGQVVGFWNEINNQKFFGLGTNPDTGVQDQSYCVWVTKTVDASNVDASLVDGSMFSNFLDGYKLYVEPSANIVATDLSDLITDVVDKQYNFPFLNGDNLHLLLKYSPESSTSNLFSNNTQVNSRTYEVVLRMCDGAGYTGYQASTTSTAAAAAAAAGAGGAVGGGTTTTVTVTMQSHPMGAPFDVYKYTINGAEWDPTAHGNLQLSSGDTIIFDQSDTTNVGYEMGLWYLTIPNHTMIDPAVNAYVTSAGTVGVDRKLTVTHDATLYSTYSMYPGIGDTSSTTSQGGTGNNLKIEIL